MTDANAAIAAVKEYREGHQLRRRLAELASKEIANKHGISVDRARAIGSGYTDTKLTHDKLLEIRELYAEAERIRPLVRQKSMNNLAAKYHLSKVTLRKYLDLSHG